MALKTTFGRVSGWREIARKIAGRRLGVAVSGGADSVFLLHAVRELGAACCVLHVNHGLRGAESDGDEAFVRELARVAGVACFVVPGRQGRGNPEQEARRVRYDFFVDRMAAGCCDAVATGHTLDDQAETVLGRFLRGAGTAGLSGIRPELDTGGGWNIVRPLLGVRRDEIRAWLREQGVAWREDGSNGDEGFLRNRMRARLMPELMSGYNPGLPRTLAATAEWARGEEEYWTAEMDRLEPVFLMASGETVTIALAALEELPLAVRRRLLRRGMERVRGSLRGIDFEHVEKLVALAGSARGSGRVEVPGLAALRSFGWMQLAPAGFGRLRERGFGVELHVPGVTATEGRGVVIETELGTKRHVYNSDVNAVDGDRCGPGLFLRNWRAGDRYCPRGFSKPVKIKDLFQRYAVPSWEREGWPVIVGSGRIVWSRGFGTADEFSVDSESERVFVFRELRESNSRVSTSIQLKAAGELKHARLPRSIRAGAEVL